MVSCISVVRLSLSDDEPGLVAVTVPLLVEYDLQYDFPIFPCSILNYSGLIALGICTIRFLIRRDYEVETSIGF